MDRGKPPHLRGVIKQQQQQQSSIVNNKTTKTTYAESLSSLPSNVRGASVVKSTPSMWNLYAGQASSSQAITARDQSASISSWNEHVRTPAKLEKPQLPHLRDLPAATTQAPKAQLSKAQLSKAQLPKAQLPMNAGKPAKSAKQDSKVPCTYEDCTRGFTNVADMKKHKAQDHEWCRICDVDCADDLAMLEHKVQSEMHICCDVCGEDFRSERGKERHMRQNHAKAQQVVCPACHIIFEKGSTLIEHIYNNRCRDRNGFIAEKVNENTIREYRAAAALHMDAISNQPSTIGAEIAAMQPQSERGTSFVDNSEGGVRVNLMDDNTPYGHLTARSLSRAGDPEDPDLIDLGSTKACDGTESPTFDDNEPGLPAISGGKGKGAAVEGGVIEGLQALRAESSSVTPAAKQPWSAKLFPGARPTPVEGGWTPPVTPNYRRNFSPTPSGAEPRFRTDWDTLVLERDSVDDMYHCPFTKCLQAFDNLGYLRSHLASGCHQGTDNRCLKCLKVFKSPIALTAHMESNSERCKIRETQAYGHVLHMVSGGFLKVTGRHDDGSIKVEAPTMEEIEEQMQSEALPPHLDEDYPW